MFSSSVQLGGHPCGPTLPCDWPLLLGPGVVINRSVSSINICQVTLITYTVTNLQLLCYSVIYSSIFSAPLVLSVGVIYARNNMMSWWRPYDIVESEQERNCVFQKLFYFSSKLYGVIIHFIRIVLTRRFKRVVLS